jgi:phosphogluconate dehydratase
VSLQTIFNQGIAMTDLLNPAVAKVTERIIERSAKTRATYLQHIQQQKQQGKSRPLSCGNMAHVVAASPAPDKFRIIEHKTANLGIVTAYNDMLSAHQPFEHYPELIKQTARNAGASAQVAGGVPAMCDGVTQGQPGMDLSLFSRDVIAMGAAVALSHNVFDGAIFLGVCDKIVPGLVIAAATFGHIPSIFLPAGPMVSGIPNKEKARIRQDYAAGKIDRTELLRGEMASYHSPGTCTFYGTANSNQMLMEFMGLQLPGSSFINPNTPLREALTKAGVQQLLKLTASPEAITTADILNEQAFVNGIVGLHATGGSTNLVLHVVAMARAAGILIEPEDFADLSAVTPLVAHVYPNGAADVNHFHAAGGLQFVIAELLEAGLLHADVQTVAGAGLAHYTQDAVLFDNAEAVQWQPTVQKSLDDNVLRSAAEPFQATGGLLRLQGSLGEAVMKVSALKTPDAVIEAPARVFEDQAAVKTAFEAGELNGDFICVVRFQGPKACGMPELHGLTPILGLCQDRGQKVALVTDGRMSGASGKVPAAIHLSPEAIDGGNISRINDGDTIRIDLAAGTLEVLNITAAELDSRPAAVRTTDEHSWGLGRELFGGFRQQVSSASTGASVLFNDGDK